MVASQTPLSGTAHVCIGRDDASDSEAGKSRWSLAEVHARPSGGEVSRTGYVLRALGIPKVFALWLHAWHHFCGVAVWALGISGVLKPVGLVVRRGTKMWSAYRPSPAPTADACLSCDVDVVCHNAAAIFNDQQDQVDMIYWPAEGQISFETACEKAVIEKRPLSLANGVHATLDKSFEMRKGREVLRIFGGEASVIEGFGHSIFTLAGRGTTLELHNVDLRHATPSMSGDGKDVGGALFLMGNATAELSNVGVSSANGLGIWIVQRAQLRARRCRVTDVARSGFALFGDASADLINCNISHCGVHGACARGRTRLRLEACKVGDCGRRGVYIYQNGSLEMSDCEINGTIDPTRAAFEAAGSRDGDAVRADLRNCQIRDNIGVGVRLRGAVAYRLENNTCVNNAESDLHILHGEVNGARPTTRIAPTGVYAVSRDETTDNATCGVVVGGSVGSIGAAR
eukprot:TRINITY_DN64181_c0_g1_i1.p1 TRINITY_DN64181_c0_g1~~TRINITY_DN64181_c0_g1_i1.p1  ORF type:complete len:470 (+),score=70.27 TRINITY_DN64181_c0_g1_i1:39-1412(+)